MQFSAGLGANIGAQVGGIFDSGSIGMQMSILLDEGCSKGFDGKAGCLHGPSLDFDLDIAAPGMAFTVGIGLKRDHIFQAIQNPFDSANWGDVHLLIAAAFGTNVKLFVFGMVVGYGLSPTNGQVQSTLDTLKSTGKAIILFLQGLLSAIGEMIKKATSKSLEREQMISSAGRGVAIDRSDAAIEDLEVLADSVQSKIATAKYNHQMGQVAHAMRILEDMGISEGYEGFAPFKTSKM